MQPLLWAPQIPSGAGSLSSQGLEPRNTKDGLQGGGLGCTRSRVEGANPQA